MKRLFTAINYKDGDAKIMPSAVPNDDFRASEVPPITAPWHVISAFALTFNGYETIGEKECGTLANRVKQAFLANTLFLQAVSLTELRACLFFEQRRHHHFGDEPEGNDRGFVNALLEAIRQKG